MANYEEFMDPDSAIAQIIAQMQGAANRSNPGLPPGGAQPGPVGTGPGMNEVMGPSRGGMEAVNRMGLQPPLQEEMTTDPFTAGDPQAIIRALLGRMGR